ncbi:MAG TPA: hypothetical protein VFM10_13470 [Terriglobales bacterium]|jgi:hypothetical protein|nr:hypothetical protein [Terriglobales bacterium]
MSGDLCSFNSLLLSEAVLCADCEMISNSRNVCRCCGSTAVLSLSQLLGGSLLKVERAVLLKWPERVQDGAGPFEPDQTSDTLAA